MSLSINYFHFLVMNNYKTLRSAKKYNCVYSLLYRPSSNKSERDVYLVQRQGSYLCTARISERDAVCLLDCCDADFIRKIINIIAI